MSLMHPKILDLDPADHPVAVDLVLRQEPEEEEDEDDDDDDDGKDDADEDEELDEGYSE